MKLLKITESRPRVVIRENNDDHSNAYIGTVAVAHVLYIKLILHVVLQTCNVLCMYRACIVMIVRHVHV